MAIQHPSVEQLSSLADGECSAAEAHAYKEHLFGCAACRSTFASFRSLDLELRRAPQVACDAALPLISASLDEETDEAEAAVAERHLETCASCRETEQTWSNVAAALAALPAGSPSVRVDEAIGAIARRERRVRAPIARPLFAGARALAAATVAVAIVAIAVAPQGGNAPVAEQPQQQPEQVLVAAAQSVVLNDRTNTLYVLDTANAAVEARDAATSELKARIEVGGKPTALALNVSANTVLVLDSSQKKVTEIDGAKNTVVSTASVPVSGTLTSINVEPNGGKILVTSAQDSTASAGSSSSLVVIDGSTKQVEAMRDLAVEPGVMIYDPMGHRAALVSTKQTTLLDDSYRVIGTLPGGVAAAFGKDKDRIAVLGATSAGSIVTFGGTSAPLSIQLPGSPRAITALPDGGFLVLVTMDKKSRVSHVAPDGKIAGDVDLPINATGIAYDSASDRFTVVNGDKVVKSSVPTQIALAPAESSAPNASPTASASAAPSPSASPAASSSPSPSASASAAPSASPSQPATAARSSNALQSASSVSGDVSRFTLLGGGLPVLVTKSNERLWVLDDTNQVVTIDMSGGEMFAPLRLPAGAQITQWKAGRSYTYALDTSAGVLYVINVRSELSEARQVPQLRPVVSSAVGFDDRLWMAVRGAPYLLAFDPKTGDVSSFDLGLARVAMLTIDSLGRILYADDTRHTVGTFDPKAQILNEVKLPTRGQTTSLVVDSSSTLWVSTTAGEIYQVRGGRPMLAVSLRVPVTTLSLDQTGHVWYLAPLPTGAVGYGFAALDELPAGSQVNGPVASLDFSALGRAWLADPRGGFFVSREQLR